VAGIAAVLFVVMVIIFASAGALCRAEGDDTGSIAMRPADLMAAVSQNAANLKSGVFSASGLCVQTGEKVSGGGKYSTNIRIFSAFDEPAKLFRFDREQKHKTPDGETQGGAQYVSTPTHVILRREGATSLAIKPPGEKPLTGTDPFRIQTLGIANTNELVKAYELATYIDKGLFHDERVVECVAESNSLYRVSCHLGKSGEAKRTIWFGRDVGWMPVRMEERYAKIGKDFPKEAPFVWADEEHLCEVRWIKVGSTWVPSRVKSDYRSGMFREPPVPTLTDSYELDFQWKSVNQSVDPRYFILEGLDLPPGSLVFDFRDSKPYRVN